jgi:hypothetical protein
VWSEWESRVIELSKYRFSRAKEVLHDAETLLKEKNRYRKLMK